MKNSRVVLTVAAMLVVASILLVWKPAERWWLALTDSSPSQVRVGAVLPLTGPLSFFGGPERDALLFAHEDIVESRMLAPMELKLVFEDSQSGAKGGVSAFSKLSAQGLKLIITSLTTVCEATQPISMERKILQIALSVDPSLAKKSPLTIRPYYGFEGEMEKTASYIQQQGGKRVAALYVNVPETSEAVKVDLVPLLQRFNAQLVANESYSFGTLDVRSLLAKIAESKPDVIVAMDFGTTYPNILKEAEALGIRKKLICGIGVLTMPKVEDALLEGVVVVAPAFVIKPSETFSDFAARFEGRFGRSPNYDECYTYDALHVVAKGIQKGGEDPERIAGTILSLGTYEGVSGALTIRNDGNMTVDIGIGIFKFGKIVPLI